MDQAGNLTPLNGHHADGNQPTTTDFSIKKKGGDGAVALQKAISITDDKIIRSYLR